MLLPKLQQPTKPTQPVSIASEMRQFGDAEILRLGVSSTECKTRSVYNSETLAGGPRRTRVSNEKPEERERVVRESELKPIDDRKD